MIHITVRRGLSSVFVFVWREFERAKETDLLLATSGSLGRVVDFMTYKRAEFKDIGRFSAWMSADAEQRLEEDEREYPVVQVGRGQYNENGSGTGGEGLTPFTLVASLSTRAPRSLSRLSFSMSRLEERWRLRAFRSVLILAAGARGTALTISFPAPFDTRMGSKVRHQR